MITPFRFDPDELSSTKAHDVATPAAQVESAPLTFPNVKFVITGRAVPPGLPVLFVM